MVDGLDNVHDRQCYLERDQRHRVLGGRIETRTCAALPGGQIHVRSTGSRIHLEACYK